MTAMDIRFRALAPLSSGQAESLARLSDVYGIRALRLNEQAGDIAIDYDATRMDAARVAALIRACGVAIA
jgi:hypothetical protein